jgi:hypothetical protein
MAGSISLNSTLGGTVVITVADSANTNYLTIPAANGIAVHSVANTGYGYAANTGATIIASGNTAQRPSSSANGAIRFNTSNNVVEYYVSGAWSPINSYTASYLVVAGGGGGAGGQDGVRYSGGGGGGTVASGTIAVLVVGTSYTVTVGAGGAGGATASNGANGSNSVFGSITSTGGAGALGASGGIAGANGGNGGAGAAPGSAGSSGTFLYAAGGGGSRGGVGGVYGGGDGGASNFAGVAAVANSGSGGGGGDPLNSRVGGAGGSGIVFITVPTSFYSGTTTGSPTVTTSGTNTILKFTSSGTYTA